VSSEPDEQRRVRAAQNQSLFREVNERIEHLNDLFQSFTDVGDWVCECADRTCIEKIPMTLPEYEAIRSDGNRFAVKPGHEIAEVEVVIERKDNYLVVQKLGAGAAVAAERDPRAGVSRTDGG
jgi:hypothetical protein